jgi:hypothetical protein
MKNLVKLALGAALIGGIAVADIAPATAGVAVGVSVGGGGGHGRWCWRHPHQCGYGRPAGYVAVGGPRIGVFYGGHGWWDGHRYWGHRYAYHGGWRYR